MKKTLPTLIIIVIIVLAAWYAFADLKSPSTSTGVGTNLTPISTVSYACNSDKSIKAEFYEGTSTPSTDPNQPPTPGGSVKVNLSDGRSMTLAQTISADGARYANSDESFVFWSKGNGALVLENNQQKSYIGCIRVAEQPAGSSLAQVYLNSDNGFTIRFPKVVSSDSEGFSDSYKADESYKYNLAPNKTISGIKFTIPENMATGTNLASDSYISVESIPQSQTCSASAFLYGSPKVSEVTDGGVTYSFATSSDAGAGNRYEEFVYAIPGTNPCTAVRYFIHYSVIDNYPAGTVKEFNEQALISQFDQIRRTLVINR